MGKAEGANPTGPDPAALAELEDAAGVRQAKDGMKGRGKTTGDTDQAPTVDGETSRARSRAHRGAESGFANRGDQISPA